MLILYALDAAEGARYRYFFRQSPLQWVSIIGPDAALAADDALQTWFARTLDRPCQGFTRGEPARAERG